MSMIAPAFINTTLLSLTRSNDFSRQIEICEADPVQCLWQKDAFLRRSLYVTSQDEVCGQLKAKYLDVPQVGVAIDGELNRDTEPTLWGIIRINYSMMREHCLASNGEH
jgi:hypothetical protein